MVLNQQLTEKKYKLFYDSITIELEGWLPYTIDYLERKKDGLNKEYKENNKYVSEFITDDKKPYTKQYHDAWSRCPYKQELIDLIKNADYLETESALKVFEEITGISAVNGSLLSCRQTS